jgi:hypothetical protein
MKTKEKHKKVAVSESVRRKDPVDGSPSTASVAKKTPNVSAIFHFIPWYIVHYFIDSSMISLLHAEEKAHLQESVSRWRGKPSSASAKVSAIFQFYSLVDCSLFY